MAYLRIALVVIVCVYAPAATSGMTDCAKVAEDTLSSIPTPNLPSDEARNDYINAVTRVFASMLTECAKRECRRDVRECIKVREYEEAERRLRQPN